MSAILHTDPNEYALIETFNSTGTIAARVPEVLSGSETGWLYSDATAGNRYTVTSAGSLIIGASSENVEVASIDHDASVRNWYLEFSTLAASEHIRFFIKKSSDNLDRDATGFDGIAIYLKNNAGALETRMQSQTDGVGDGTDTISYAEHSSGLDATARIAAHITFDGTNVVLTIDGVAKTLTLVSTKGDYDANNYIGVHLNNVLTGTAEIHEVRAW